MRSIHLLRMCSKPSRDGDRYPYSSRRCSAVRGWSNQGPTSISRLYGTESSATLPHSVSVWPRLTQSQVKGCIKSMLAHPANQYSGRASSFVPAPSNLPQCQWFSSPAPPSAKDMPTAQPLNFWQGPVSAPPACAPDPRHLKLQVPESDQCSNGADDILVVHEPVHFQPPEPGQPRNVLHAAMHSRVKWCPLLGQGPTGPHSTTHQALTTIAGMMRGQFRMMSVWSERQKSMHSSHTCCPEKASQSHS